MYVNLILNIPFVSVQIQIFLMEFSKFSFLLFKTENNDVKI